MFKVAASVPLFASAHSAARGANAQASGEKERREKADDWGQALGQTGSGPRFLH